MLPVPDSSQKRPRNPFRQPTRRSAFEAAVTCYLTQHRDLFRPDGSRANGSAPTVWFWRGFDEAHAERWRGDAKEMNAYAFWRAGQAIARMLRQQGV